MQKLILLTLVALGRLFALEAADKQEEGVAVGIDLGTTYSAVGYFHPKDGTVEIITDIQGEEITPSVVLFDPIKNKFEVGKSAKDYIGPNQNKFYDSKRLIGRPFHSETVRKDMENWPFTIVDFGGKPAFKPTMDGETTKQYTKQFGKRNPFSPEEISAQILKYLKESAELRLGKKVTKAVITVPAYFGDPQRQATKDAGAIAGLEVLRIINEPTAAAIAYGLDQKVKEKMVLVFDLGGGTFDVSILEIDGGFFEVKATKGHSHLGGQDFDRFLMDIYLDKTGLKFDDLTNREQNILKNESERVKKMLSSTTEVDFTMEIGGKKRTVKITRTEFQKKIAPKIKQALDYVEQALRDINVSKSDIQEVILVGGSTRIPYVVEQVEKLMGKKANTKIDPDKAVAYGAAVQAAILTKTKADVLTGVLVVDVAPLALGIETAGGVMAAIINKNEKIPIKRSQTFTTVSRNQSAVEINIYQGPSPLVRKNKLLGSFKLEDIAHNHPEIEITFDIDYDGIVSVSALEKGNQRAAEIKLDKVGAISEDEMNRIMEEFKASEELDKREANIIKIKHDIISNGTKISEQNADETTKKKVADILNEVNAITDYSEESEEKIKDISARFQTIMQMAGGGAGAGPQGSAAHGQHATNTDTDGEDEL